MVRITISSGAQSMQNKLLGQGLLESAFDGMIPSGNVKQPRQRFEDGPEKRKKTASLGLLHETTRLRTRACVVRGTLFETCQLPNPVYSCLWFSCKFPVTGHMVQPSYP